MLLLRFVFVQIVCLCLEIFLQPVDFYLTTLSAGDNIKACDRAYFTSSALQTGGAESPEEEVIS